MENNHIKRVIDPPPPLPKNQHDSIDHIKINVIKINRFNLLIS